MISSEVQRTLVKSPPELWAEISDPEALTRHLGEFGEIRITRVQPEQTVEWEAPDASGSIVIKPSGWGTKVKLTVTREMSGAETGAEPNQTSERGEELAIEQVQEAETTAALEAEVESESHDELDGAAAEVITDGPLAEGMLTGEDLEYAEGPVPSSLPLDAHESDPLPEPADESDRQPKGPERRLGFFARLFGRRRAARTAPDEPDFSTPEIAEDDYSDLNIASSEVGLSDETSGLAAAAAIDAEAELDAELRPTPATPPTSGADIPPNPAATDATEAAGRLELDGTIEHHSPSDAQADLAAELEQAEEAATEQVTAVLTGVLDRLGAAHHRPFSRA